MLKKNGILLLLVSISQLIFAQNAYIKGVVLDENKQVIVGSYITISNFSNLGTSTDENGQFLLKVPANKPLEIKVSAINYTNFFTTLSLKPDETKILTFKLKDSFYSIDSTIVIGQRRAYRDQEQMLEIDVKNASLPSTTGDISSFLEAQAFIQKNNELSTAYAVRGGN